MNRRRGNAIKRTPAAPALAAPAPAPVPAPASPVGPSQPSLSAIAKQGFGWGLGNAAAHSLVNSFFYKTPDTVGEPTILPTNSIEYTQCMKDFEDKEACKHLLM